jgi:hypothetical protein
MSRIMKIRPVGAELFYADGQPQDEANTAEPWIASIIRSRNVLVIQNTRISK